MWAIAQFSLLKMRESAFYMLMILAAVICVFTNTADPVSEQVAKEMALGSLYAYDADIAGSVTGIAGPNGGTPEKPVGTVWMAVTDGKMTKTFENHFKGTRDEIRASTRDVLIDHIIEFVGSR